MAQRYLVSGCAGFIGANVCQGLLDAGHEVVGWDNLNDAYDPRLKLWRLEKLRVHRGFEFTRLDIGDRLAVEQAAAELWRPHVGAPPLAGVINLAARAGVRPSVDDPWVYLQTNCGGTLNLLELCRRCSVAKFVLASTSSLYGNHNTVPFAEDADTNRPLSPYAASKKAAEALAYTYHHLHGIDTTVLRFFTVYGPAGRPDMAVFRFIRRIDAGLPITVFGDGSQRRDFTFVEDIARGTIAAVRPLGYEVINLGSDQPIVLSDMIRELGQLLDRQPKIEYQLAHPADADATWAQIGKAERLLTWRPATSFAEGLQRSVAWHRQHTELLAKLRIE